jgi:hypothetical protein
MTVFGDNIFAPQQAARGRRKQPTHGYIPIFDDALLADEPVEADAVTPEERESVLSQIGEATGGTVARLADLISMPGEYLRGAAVGQVGERLSGRELNRALGLAGPEDTWGNFVGGLATDIVTDPLSLLSGPTKALTPAGKAAAKLAGPVGSLLDTAPIAMTRKAISGGLDKAALPAVAQRTRKALEATGRKISTFDPATVGRPLYGVRTSRRAGTLDDLIKYSDDPDKMEEAARQLLGDNLDKIRNQPLAKSFGVGLPFQDPAIVGDFLGKGFGDKYADVLDTVGQTMRWSAPGRVAAAAFDSRVGGVIDPEEQITNIANWQARTTGAAQAAGRQTAMLSRIQQESPDAFSPEGNERLGRYLEGPNVRTPEDVDFVESRPSLKEYADSWISDRQSNLAARRQLGLSSEPLKDAYGIDYLPRQAEASLQMASKRNKALKNALSAFTPDSLGRTKAFQVPGGRQSIIDLSQDTNVAGPKRLLKEDDRAGQYIADLLNGRRRLAPDGTVLPGQPEVTLKQGIKIARTLSELPDEVVKKAPLFGQHPTDMIFDHMKNQGEAAGTATTLYDSVATMSKNAKYTQVDTSKGGRHISVSDALNRLGLKSYDDSLDDILDGTGRSIDQRIGAAQQMRERLAKLTGEDPDSINLSEWSIPEEHITRLTRAKDAFSGDEVSNTLLNWLDSYTAVWKGSILAWPSRSTRDLLSGAISNWMEGALDGGSVRAARALVMEGPQSQDFQSVLRSIPRYATDDGLNQFYADLAATGLTRGSGLNEIGASVVGLRARDALVGSDPISMTSIGRELSKGWDRNSFFSVRTVNSPTTDTLNPILRAGERANTLTDNVNRLTGYLALLKKGYEPMSAAAAMKRAHVDYTSLTQFERGFLRRVIPWYSYQSRIFREVLRQVAERPGGRYGQLIQLGEDIQDGSEDGPYVPSSIRSQLAIPIPPEWGGTPAPGTQAYFKLGSMIPGAEQINMLETPVSLSGAGITQAAGGTLRKAAMQANPFLRAVVEGVSGEDLYTRQPLGEATTALDAALRAATGNQNANVPFVVDKGVELLPFAARPLGVVRSMLDTRGDQPLSSRAAKTAFNTLAGIRVEDVDRQRALADAVREIDKSIDPYTREFTQAYIPEQLQPQVPEWALRRQAVSRALARERRDARKPKKKDKRASAPANLFQ